MEGNKQSSKSCLSSFLEDCDIFGVPISVRFSGNEKHKSNIGAVATFIIFIALFLQSYDEIRILFFRSNFQVVFQENMVKSPKPYNLSPKQFTLAVGLKDSQQQNIFDETLFQVQAVHKTVERVYNNTDKQFHLIYKSEGIKLVQCTKDHFQIEETEQYFFQSSFNKLYCLPLEQNIYIEGQQGSDVFKTFTFYISKCNTSTNAKCKSTQQIDDRLADSFLEVYFVNYAIEITNNNKPFQAAPQYLSYKMENTQKNINIYFKNAYIETDDGLFAPNNKAEQKLLQSSDREQVINKRNDYLFEVNIGMERNKEIFYSRKYTRLISTFSKLGGLFNFFYSVGILICYPFSKILFKQKLLNSIFSFQNKEEIGQNVLHDFTYNEPISPQKKLIANMPHTSDIDFKIAKKNSLQNLSEQNSSKKVSNISQFNSMNALSNNNNNNNNSGNLNNFQSNNTFEEQATPNIKQLEAPQSEYNQHIIQLERHRSSLKTATVINLNNVRKNIFRKKTQYKTQIQVNDKIISSFFSTTVNSFKVRFHDIFMSYLCQKRSKSKMISYGMNKLNYHLDINTIITKLLELEKLKRLLLDKDQIKLFEFIPKPIVHEEQFDVDNATGITEHQSFAISNTGILYEDKRSITQKAKEAEEAYHRIVNKNKESDLPINRKLLQLIDPRISTQFELNTFSRNCETNTVGNLDFSKESSKEIIKDLHTPQSQKVIRSNFYSFNLNETNKY